MILSVLIADSGQAAKWYEMRYWCPPHAMPFKDEGNCSLPGFLVSLCFFNSKNGIPSKYLHTSL